MPRPEPSFDPADVVGWDAEAAARRFREDGFVVEVVDLARTSWMTAEYRENRVRLMVRAGRVVDVRQG